MSLGLDRTLNDVLYAIVSAEMVNTDVKSTRLGECCDDAGKLSPR